MNNFIATLEQYNTATYGIFPFAIGFSIGIILGYLIGCFAKNGSAKYWERSIISIVVLIMWAVSVTADMFLDNYSTPTAIHAIMGLVAGYFFEGSLSDAFGKKLQMAPKE